MLSDAYTPAVSSCEDVPVPIYEYVCESCKQSFEQLVRSKRDESRLTCPACGHERIERRPSVFAAHARSSGVPLPTGGCGRCGDPNGPCGLD